MTPEATIEIEAPKNLPANMQKEWKSRFAAAHRQAVIDIPENPRAQRTAAAKAANRMLAVPAPKSAAEIDALEDWQVLERKTSGGMRRCVTADGRKYSFPEAAQKPAPTDIAKMNKDQLVAHAAEAHGLTLDPAMKKDDMVSAIEAAKADAPQS